MQQLKRQVSCVRIDLNNLAELTENIDRPPDDVFIEHNLSNGNGDVDLPPPSPFLDKNGQPIRRKSKCRLVQKQKKRRHQMYTIICVEVINIIGLDRFKRAESV